MAYKVFVILVLLTVIFNCYCQEPWHKETERDHITKTAGYSGHTYPHYNRATASERRPNNGGYNAPKTFPTNPTHQTGSGLYQINVNSHVQNNYGNPVVNSYGTAWPSEVVQNNLNSKVLNNYAAGIKKQETAHPASRGNTGLNVYQNNFNSTVFEINSGTRNNPGSDWRTLPMIGKKKKTLVFSASSTEEPFAAHNRGNDGGNNQYKVYVTEVPDQSFAPTVIMHKAKKMGAGNSNGYGNTYWDQNRERYDPAPNVMGRGYQGYNDNWHEQRWS